MTIDAVAARAQAGKGTVYRRWANKAELVADALAQRHAAKPVPDTGSLRLDLEILLTDAGEGSEEYRARLFAGLVPALAQSPELQAAFGRVRAAGSVRVVVERAVERGEIPPPHDPDLVAALFPALSVYRFVLYGELHDPEFASSFISRILMPLLQHPSTEDTDRP
jgi:AcrR family transcriptional regulator